MSGHQQAAAAIREISDTALWVAVYRARESEREDAAFNDPYARMLAGERGESLVQAMGFGDDTGWSFLGRTYLFDKYIQQEVEAGADLVLNLACGLDTRPYRMDLPKELCWVEVDLPELLEYKERILNHAGAQPICEFTRIALDLSDIPARRALFDQIAAEHQRVLVVSEGLLIYLSREDNAELADELASYETFQRWVFDISSPALLKMVQSNFEKVSAVPLKFAPEEGLAFYEAHGWQRMEVQSQAHGANAINRLPEFIKPYLSTPMPEPPGDAIWGGTALLGRKEKQEE